MKKFLLLLFKYIPVMQMAGILINNLLYYFDICRNVCYCIDFIFGNSIITTVLLFVCSYIFKFCKWHKIIITANFINLMIANIDCIITIPINDLSLLIIYYFIAIVFIIIATITHLQKKQIK